VTAIEYQGTCSIIDACIPFIFIANPPVVRIFRINLDAPNFLSTNLDGSEEGVQVGCIDQRLRIAPRRIQSKNEKDQR
jgi:hypothetical protein